MAVSCGVGRRRGSDPAWLWLWWRRAAVALIRPLAWDPPYAAGAVLKIQHTHTHTKNQPDEWIKKTWEEEGDEGIGCLQKPPRQPPWRSRSKCKIKCLVQRELKKQN